MKRPLTFTTLGLCGMLLFTGPLYAESDGMRQANLRIKQLRERLDAFRAKVLPKKDEVKDQPEFNPDRLSDELEHRKDTKVIVLFSESAAPAESSFKKADMKVEKAELIKNLKHFDKTPTKKTRIPGTRTVRLAKAR